MTAVLRVRDVVTDGTGGFRLGPLSLEMARGEALAVVGRAGAGKSLFLRSLIGLSWPRAGTVEIDGVPLERERLRELRDKVGFAFQRDALVDDLTALENVALAARGRGRGNASDRARAALDAVGLEGAYDKLPMELSGGMRRRVGLARALVTEPALLLCDDATAGLDPSTSVEVLERVLKGARRGDAAVLLSTHDVDAVLPRVDRVLLLEAGRVSYLGSAAGLLTREETRAFAPLLGEAST